LARLFGHSPKSINASLNPLRKKNWHQIQDDYSQYLLGSTLYQPHAGSREVLFLQEHHQPKRISLGNPSHTTMAQCTTYDIFADWTRATTPRVPTATPSLTPSSRHAHKTNQAILSAASLLAFCLYTITFFMICKARNTDPATQAIPPARCHCSPMNGTT